jgi:hypothetical protein
MTWVSGMREELAGAGGLLTLHVFRRADLPALLEQARAGDHKAFQLAGALENTLMGIDTAPRRRPALCGSCPRPVRGDNLSIVIVCPESADASHGLGLAICKRCATEPDAILANAVVALRRIWPDARPVTIAGYGPGHA